MTASELKFHCEQSGNEPYFFTRFTMKFFGDTMRNYGVRQTAITTYAGESMGVWELYRKHPVNHGLKDSAYFCPNTFKRVFAAR